MRIEVMNTGNLALSSYGVRLMVKLRREHLFLYIPWN